jgi:hypothetical protein
VKPILSPLGDREADVLGIIGQLLARTEGAATITRGAVEFAMDGPVTGSVAVLVERGLLRRGEMTDEGPALAITELGRRALAFELNRRRGGSIVVPRRVNGG